MYFRSKLVLYKCINILDIFFFRVLPGLSPMLPITWIGTHTHSHLRTI